MKRVEIIEKYQDKIEEKLPELYREVLESDGRIQYKLYIWEDGDLEALYGAQGDTGFLRPRRMEPRELIYLATVDAPYFSAWDFADHARPEDEDEAEAERAEIIDALVSDYERDITDVMDRILDDARHADEYDEDMAY